MHDQTTLFPDEQRNLELSQWFTPPELARRVLEWADLPPGARILEPSAGDGAFIKAGPQFRWQAVEIDERHVEKLVALRDGIDLEVMQADFLTLAAPAIGEFDAVVLNPPYECDADVDHVLHAMRFAPRVIALLRSAFRHGVGRWDNFWSVVRPVRQVELISRPVFGEGNGARSDFTVWEFRRRKREVERGAPSKVAVEVEWW